jgi:hypothetical protein
MSTVQMPTVLSSVSRAVHFTSDIVSAAGHDHGHCFLEILIYSRCSQQFFSSTHNPFTAHLCSPKHLQARQFPSLPKLIFHQTRVAPRHDEVLDAPRLYGHHFNGCPSRPLSIRMDAHASWLFRCRFPVHATGQDAGTTSGDMRSLESCYASRTDTAPIPSRVGA